MIDKFNMTIEQNISLAKRNLVENIYHSAQFEGLNITFSETYAIIEKAVLEKIDISVVSTILNLKHAWQYLFKEIATPITLHLIKRINDDVAKDEALTWGELRTGKVRIAGTDYAPPIPDEGDTISRLRDFEKIEDITDRAIERMLWMMKAQLFWNGNKRTSMLIANKDLISHGKGVLSIQQKDILEFNVLLNEYYSTGEKRALKEMIYEKGISGVVLEKRLDSRKKNSS